MVDSGWGEVVNKGNLGVRYPNLYLKRVRPVINAFSTLPQEDDGPKNPMNKYPTCKTWACYNKVASPTRKRPGPATGL